MFEFGGRLLFAGLLVFIAGTTNAISFTLACSLALAVGSMAVVGRLLELRKLYEGPGAALHATLEAMVISVIVVNLNQAERFGLLAVLPYGVVAARHRASWIAGAIGCSVALLAAYAIVQRAEPTDPVLIQAGAIFILGLILSLREEPIAALIPNEAEIVDDHELRGRFRALKEAYGQLERKANENAYVVSLAKASQPEAMAQTVRDATGASGAALFAPNGDEWEMIGHSGQVPEEITRSAKGIRHLQERGAAPLFSGGRPVGAVWIPDELRDKLVTISDALSIRMGERFETDTERRGRKAAELRATLLIGGDDPQAIAGTLAALIGAESVEFGKVSPFGPVPVGRFGPPCDLPNALRHASGPGLAGWASAGSPTVWISDARSDQRVDGRQALRARTAALAVVPVGNVGYVWAAWYVSGSGKAAAVSTLKAAQPILENWIMRPEGVNTTSDRLRRLPAA